MLHGEISKAFLLDTRNQITRIITAFWEVLDSDIRVGKEIKIVMVGEKRPVIICR